MFVFLAILPHVKAFHLGLGIPAEISRLTLADLGRTMAANRQQDGVGGLRTVDWLMSHFRGVIYQIGRLQFERATLGTRTGKAVQAAGEPFGPGDLTLAVHIPSRYGPLTPAACDDSFRAAGESFARYFPDEHYRTAVCHSWLLDPQLADYLPADANIIRFQRRFQQAYQPEADDATTQLFVFGRTDLTLDELPGDTTLRRAVADHLKAGRHWHGSAGWLVL
ncbi:acyltransferase domain-containing protein [Fodinicola feengrottensis]|uniref:acyltransferase domain-containing protein n=1 Tax=Fodinicola feengrottensis TaxID=435914 RepID=UPI0028BD2AAB|nr:acyltransferase domain-containing protein [Fodinicola feengrottensis]